MECFLASVVVTGGWSLNWVVWILKERLEQTCVSTSEWGLRLLFARQDSSADPFEWRPMVTLLSLWGTHWDGKIAN